MRERQQLDDSINGVKTLERQLSDNIELIEMGEEEGDVDIVKDAEERGHHDAILQKLHDFVWELIEQFGEAAIRKRIGEIDAKALNSGSRVIFDPPRREFLRKHFSAPIENVVKFPAWREYLYLNVLGFPPEPVVIETWPEEIPQPRAA